MKNPDCDVLIMGAGPVGIFSVFQCGMNGLKCHVVDAFDTIGGQCCALYPEKPIYDIPAYPSICGQELIDKLIEQSNPFKPTYHLKQKVVKIEKLNNEGNLWNVITSEGKTIVTRTIIIACGMGAFGPNKPPLKNLDSYENNIHYSVRHQHIYKDKNVVIAGGGDSALDWALILKDIAKKVYLVHRRNNFRANPDNEKKLHNCVANGEIELVTPFQLKAVEGENGVLQKVIVNDFNNIERALQADYLLPFFGLSMNIEEIKTWGLDLNNNYIKIDQSSSATNLKGVYAAGDAAYYENKLKLIMTGFAESAQAAHHIRSFLNPDKVFSFNHSTTTGIKGF